MAIRLTTRMLYGLQDMQELAAIFQKPARNLALT